MPLKLVHELMMYLIVVCALFSISYAADLNDEAQARTISFDNTNDGFGNYRFSFLTSNGIDREESGRLVNAGEKDEHIVVEGSYSYTQPDGNVVLVRYTADENGYRIINPAFIPPAAAALPANVVASLLGK